jgi:hypothetical protein
MSIKPAAGDAAPVVILDECEQSRFGAAPLSGNVEAVGKPPNFDFSRQKVLCFHRANFSKESFSTTSLDSASIKVSLNRDRP